MEIVAAFISPALVVLIGVIYIERRLSVIETDIRWLREHMLRSQPTTHG